MVSTRGGVKFKFSERERVLCYEPDPTKANVLYDSKVLDVVVKKDSRGRKSVEYLIHFQGWNSSWDRCVAESYVLKDTDENRLLQKELAEKAHLHFQERRRVSGRDSEGESVVGGTRYIPKQKMEKLKQRNSKGGGNMEVDSGSTTEENQDASSEDDMTPIVIGKENCEKSFDKAGGDVMAIVIPDVLKRVLTDDYNLIHKNNKLLSLPAKPNVVTILENYVKYYILSQLAPQETTGRPIKDNQDLDKCRINIRLCKEMVDGLRVVMDFMIFSQLLYTPEDDQYKETREINSLFIVKEVDISESEVKVAVKVEVCSDNENSNEPTEHIIIRNDHVTVKKEIVVEDEPPVQSKRVLRSQKVLPVSSSTKVPSNSSSSTTSEDCGDATENKTEETKSLSLPKSSRIRRVGSDASVSNKLEGVSHVSSVRSTCSDSISTISNQRTSSRFTTSHTILQESLKWRLIPHKMYEEVPVAPCLIYGAIHLTRLFVKLPEILHKMDIPTNKLKVLYRHFGGIIEYLSKQEHLFSEDCYEDNKYIIDVC